MKKLILKLIRPLVLQIVKEENCKKKEKNVDYFQNDSKITYSATVQK